MFSFICKSFSHLKHSLRTSPAQHELHYLQPNYLLMSFSSKVAQKPPSENTKDESFTVNYFIKTCGFAPEKAISVSNYLNFDKRPDRPDAVIAFLKNQGLSEAQVSKVVRTCPRVVLYDPEKNLLPKIEFFLSYGFSKKDLPAILVAGPSILTLSLDRNIIPSVNWLEKYLGSFEKAIVSIRRCSRMLLCFQLNVIRNTEILQKAGVPEARIRSFLIHYPRAFTRYPDKFGEVVEEVRKMGFNPEKSSFFIAVNVMLEIKRSLWKEKMEVYKKWGCSEGEVLAAFITDPWCMSVSKDKIERIMGYFVNEVGWNPSMLMKRSHILSFCLNRRIIPRCSVYLFLLSKGFISKSSSFYALLTFSEEKFCERYVKRYEKEAPELLNLYQEKMKLSR